MSASPRQWRPRRQNLTLPHVKGSKTALDSGINAVDFGFLVLDSSLRQWNLESRFQSFWDYRFLELYSVFQSPGFHRSTNINFQHFGVRIPLHGAIIGEPLTITLATQAGQIRERLSIRLQNCLYFWVFKYTVRTNS